MSLEKNAENLLEAVTALIKTVTDLIGGVNPAGTAVTADPVKEKPTKKELTELKKAAKTKAGSVLKQLGKKALSKLLANYGATKFSDVDEEPHVFKDFIIKADVMLTDKEISGGDDDDLLGDDPGKKEYTLEDVKALLLKVNNSEALGRDITRQILADLGVARLGELKKDSFKEAVEKAEAILKDADIE